MEHYTVILIHLVYKVVCLVGFRSFLFLKQTPSSTANTDVYKRQFLFFNDTVAGADNISSVSSALVSLKLTVCTEPTNGFVGMLEERRRAPVACVRELQRYWSLWRMGDQSCRVVGIEHTVHRKDQRSQIMTHTGT